MSLAFQESNYQSITLNVAAAWRSLCSLLAHNPSSIRFYVSHLTSHKYLHYDEQCDISNQTEMTTQLLNHVSRARSTNFYMEKFEITHFQRPQVACFQIASKLILNGWGNVGPRFTTLFSFLKPIRDFHRCWPYGTYVRYVRDYESSTVRTLNFCLWVWRSSQLDRCNV